MGCVEIVVDVCNRSMDVPTEDDDDYPIEHVTQEAILPDHDSDAPEEEDKSCGDDFSHESDDDDSGDKIGFDTCRVNNNFDEGDFENEEVDDNDISQSSEENEGVNTIMIWYLQKLIRHILGNKHMCYRRLGCAKHLHLFQEEPKQLRSWHQHQWEMKCQKRQLENIDQHFLEDVYLN